MTDRDWLQLAKATERAYFLCADNAKDMYAWMNSLSLAAIQYEKVGALVLLLVIARC